ncbi:MAG: TolC family protein [Geobacteraceae bacterium]|nr:TolC family protein [Geobacteraceae bacterium]
MKRPFLFTVLILLSGCAAYHPRPVVPAALMNAFEARTLASPDLQGYIAAHCGNGSACAPGVWDLKRLTLAAFYFSPLLDIARARYGSSQAAIQSAGQRPNPALKFPLGYTANAKSGESPYTFGLGLDIPIETAGKRGYRVAQARQISNAARAEIGNVAWQVRSRLRSHMLGLYAATRRAQILEQQIAAQQQIVTMLDKRLAVGAASAPEANQARIALDRIRVNLAKTQRQIQHERAKIATVIGLPVDALANIRIGFETFERIYPDIPAADVRRQAILNRADVVAALAKYEASQATLQLEIARQYPDMHIGPGYIFDAGAEKFVLLVSNIVLPLFNQNKGPIAEAEAGRTEAAARVNAVQTHAIEATARAVQDYRADRGNLLIAESLLSAQKRQLHDVQKGFAAGETDRLTRTLAQQEFYIQALIRQDALLQVQRSIGQLEDAMQRPLSATDFPAVPETEEIKR